MRAASLPLAAAALLSLGAVHGTLPRFADALAEHVVAAIGDEKWADVAVCVEGGGPRLADAVGELLATRLRARGARSAEPAACDPARAAGEGFEYVAKVTLESDGPRLRGVGRLVRAASPLWPGRDEVTALLLAEATVDGEVRALLPAVSAEAGWQSVRLGEIAGEVLALAVGDTDGDGRAELVALGPRGVTAWRPAGGRLAEAWHKALPGPAPTVRPRRPVGTLAFERGVLVVRSSELGESWLRAPDGTWRSEAGGFYLPGQGRACELQPGVDWFTPRGCGLDEREWPERFWAAARATTGGAAVRAALLPASPARRPRLWLSLGGAPPFEVPDVGAQLVVAEGPRGAVVATTLPVAGGEADGVVVRSLAPGAPVVHRADRLRGPVAALAAGELGGRWRIVAAVRLGADRAEVWSLE